MPSSSSSAYGPCYGGEEIKIYNEDLPPPPPPPHKVFLNFFS